MKNQEYLFPSAGVNCALTETSGSFDPQLPLTRKLAGTANHSCTDDPVPPGITVLPDGRLLLRFFAPEAKSVEAGINGNRCALVQEESGLWSATVNGYEGFCPVMFFVDGTEIINPMAPIGFGASRPINYAESPKADGKFYMCSDVPHGTVTQAFYPSKATGCMKSCLVYTPPGYMKETRGLYPVLYLQHGHGENEQCWVHQGKMNFILDNLIARGEAKPMVVVMNNGMVQAERAGVRMFERDAIEALLIEDCIPYIEANYRVYTDKWHRAMAGLSMGSYQTSVVTLRHPELFGYAGVFSGFVSPLDGSKGDYLDVLDDAARFEESYRLFFRACGEQDFVALERFHADAALFTEKGLSPEHSAAHVEQYYPGAHEWNVWRMCLRDFAKHIFA